MKRTGTSILLGVASALALTACLSTSAARQSFSGATRGESFAIDVRVGWWQDMAIYVGKPDNRFPTPSVVAFIASATCEARSGFLPPRPTIERRARFLFVLREVMTPAQVELSDQALISGHCAYSNPVQDFRNVFAEPNFSVELGTTTSTTIPPGP